MKKFIQTKSNVLLVEYLYLPTFSVVSMRYQTRQTCQLVLVHRQQARTKYPWLMIYSFFICGKRKKHAIVVTYRPFILAFEES